MYIEEERTRIMHMYIPYICTCIYTHMYACTCISTYMYVLTKSPWSTALKTPTAAFLWQGECASCGPPPLHLFEFRGNFHEQAEIEELFAEPIAWSDEVPSLRFIAQLAGFVHKSVVFSRQVVLGDWGSQITGLMQ